MIITNAKKYISPIGNIYCAVINGIEKWIPNNSTNMDYIELMSQFNLGQIKMEEIKS